MEGMQHAEITKKIIGVAIDVHNELGPGLAEKVYHKAMIYGLKSAGLQIDSEKQYAVYYKKVGVGLFRVDLLVQGVVIVELKALTGQTPKIFEAQTITYLKASGIEVGLLLNFGNQSLEVKRFANYKNYAKKSV